MALDAPAACRPRRRPSEPGAEGDAALPAGEGRRHRKRRKIDHNSWFPQCGNREMPQTLYDKLWDSHVVHTEDDGTALLYIDRHLVHEVTSAQAYEGLRVAGRKPWRTASIVATADHNTPTKDWNKGIRDPISRTQVETLDAN